MKTLTVQWNESVKDMVDVTGHVKMASGDEFYTCDKFLEVTLAMDEGVPFLAHEVRGGKPCERIIVPQHVESVAESGP